MKDERTEEQKYSAWVNAVIVAHQAGWKHVEGWNFKSPKGTIRDLSATNLNLLNKHANLV